jgi:glyoxylase-like metal-dependent hydrolase (beta-lactamase superfamily II)
VKRLATALAAVTLVAGCSGGAGDPTFAPSRTSGPASAASPSNPSETPSVPIGRFASDNPGSVNTYWLKAPKGLVVVDAQRSLTDARRALAALRATGSPVAAVLITHPHPDHVGGIGVLHQAYPDAPVHSSKATEAWMRADPLHFYEITRKLPGSDYAPRLTYPGHTFAPGDPVDVGGLRLETAEFGPGEAETATVYYEPRTGALFAGDLVADKATPALLEGHSCGWLVDLDRLTSRFPHVRTIYPGHGAPGDALLIEQQRSYIEAFRRLVRAAVGPKSRVGTDVTKDERESILAELDRSYPAYPSVASLPTLLEENVRSVAKELLTEDTGELPGPCRDS